MGERPCYLVARSGIVSFGPRSERREVLPVLQEERPYAGKVLYFRTIFDEKHKVGEILFLKGAFGINDLPFLKHERKANAK